MNHQSMQLYIYYIRSYCLIILLLLSSTDRFIRSGFGEPVPSLASGSCLGVKSDVILCFDSSSPSRLYILRCFSAHRNLSLCIRLTVLLSVQELTKFDLLLTGCFLFSRTVLCYMGESAASEILETTHMSTSQFSQESQK